METVGGGAVYSLVPLWPVFWGPLCSETQISSASPPCVASSSAFMAEIGGQELWVLTLVLLLTCVNLGNLLFLWASLSPSTQ